MPVSLAYTWLPLAVTALALLGCGGKSVETGSDQASGASGSGGRADRGGAASSGAPGSGGRADQGGAASSGGQCGRVLNESGPQLTVLLRNRTEGPIYIGPQRPTCVLGVDVYDVTDASGERLVMSEQCGGSCQELLRGPPRSCPPIACPVNAVITLQPGEAALQLWTAQRVEQVTLPLACRPGDGTEVCPRVVLVKPGDYVFTARAGGRTRCAFPDMCTECMRDSLGGCTTYGAVITKPIISATLAVTLDASYGIGAPAGGATPLPIEIVFN